MTQPLAHRFPTLGLLVLLVLPGAAPPRAQDQEDPPAPVTLSLQECLKTALENNLDIAVRRYEPQRSEALLMGQRAIFDPLLTGSGRSTEDQRLLTFFPGAPLSTDKTHAFTAAFEDPLQFGGRYRLEINANDNLNITDFAASAEQSRSFETTWKFTFTQPLLRNLGTAANRWQILVATNSLGSSEARFRQTVIDTLAGAENAYWDLNFTLMDLKTKRGSLQLAKDFLDQNRTKVRVGTLAPIEITQAEAGVADREEGVILAEHAVRTAEDALRRIMNVPRDSPVWSTPIQPLDAPPLVESAPDMAQAVATAETHRPDLEEARFQVRSREAELHYRENQRRWGLDFQGSYGALGADGGDPVLNGPFNYGNALDDLRERNQDNWSLGLNLSVPIGNRQAIANFTNAEHGLNQARYELLRLEQLARLEVRNAARTVDTNLKRVKAAQVNTRLQREKLDAEQKKFQNGMSTSFQVLQFQTDLASAETRENLAIVDYNKSLVEMERVQGTLLEARRMLIPGDAGGAHGGPPSGGPSAALPTHFGYSGRALVGLGGKPGAAGDPADGGR